MVFGSDTKPPAHPAPTSLDAVRPLDLRAAVRYTNEGRLWNEFVARYNYLDYKGLVGAPMCYAVHDRADRRVTLPGFSTTAPKPVPATASSDGRRNCGKGTCPS